MRRDLVELLVKETIENPPKIDLPTPWRVELTPEEMEYADQLLKEESDKLTEWAEPVIM